MRRDWNFASDFEPWNSALQLNFQAFYALLPQPHRAAVFDDAA
jgi:hypothetical protein